MGDESQANEIDGVVLECRAKDVEVSESDLIGLVFEDGQVTKWTIAGNKVVSSFPLPYVLVGPHEVRWWGWSNDGVVRRDTMTFNNNHFCEVSKKSVFFEKLSKIKNVAVKKNKF